MRTLEHLWREYDAIEEEWKKCLERLWRTGEPPPQGASTEDLSAYGRARDALKAKLEEIDRFSSGEGRK